MKKIYIQPEILVVKMQAENALLTLSKGDDWNSGEAAAPTLNDDELFQLFLIK